MCKLENISNKIMNLILELYEYWKSCVSIFEQKTIQPFENKSNKKFRYLTTFQSPFIKSILDGGKLLYVAYISYFKDMILLNVSILPHQCAAHVFRNKLLWIQGLDLTHFVLSNYTRLEHNLLQKVFFKSISNIFKDKPTLSRYFTNYLNVSSYIALRMQRMNCHILRQSND